MKSVDDTNMIEVMGESTDPQKAADAPNALLHLYITQDVNQSLNDIKTTLDFARQQCVRPG